MISIEFEPMTIDPQTGVATKRVVLCTPEPGSMDMVRRADLCGVELLGAPCLDSGVYLWRVQVQPRDRPAPLFPWVLRLILDELNTLNAGAA